MVNNIVLVGHCNKCNTESTLAIKQSITRIDQRIKDCFDVLCLNCGENYIIDFIPDSYASIFDIDSDKIGHTILPVVSEDYSIKYIKSDLFYLLNMFFRYNKQPINDDINDKNNYVWTFSFRLPSIRKEKVFVDLRLINGNTLYVTSNYKVIDSNDEVIIMNNLNNLFNYIIAFCDENTNGYFSNLITVRELGEQNTKIEDIRSHFGSLYGAKYRSAKLPLGNLSAAVTSAVSQPSYISNLLPKVNTSGGVKWTSTK